MRPIKFRGKTFDDKLVYGDLIHVDENIFIDITPVKPESVAQLVGYDDDGNEVYDDDCLVRDNGAEAGMNFFIETEDEDGDHDIFNIGEKLYGYKLKES